MIPEDAGNHVRFDHSAGLTCNTLKSQMTKKFTPTVGFILFRKISGSNEMASCIRTQSERRTCDCRQPIRLRTPEKDFTSLVIQHTKLRRAIEMQQQKRERGENRPDR